MGRKEFTQGTQKLAPSEAQATSTLVANSADISGGVTADVTSDEFCIQIAGTGGDNIKVEISPDGGSTFFTVDESPFSIGSDGDTTIQMQYSTTTVRITNTSGTNATTVMITER